MNLFDDEEDVLDKTPKDDSKETKYTGKTFDDLQKEHNESIKNLVDKTKHLSPESLVKLMKEEFPDYNENVIDYRDNFMNSVEAEIASGKTDEEREKIRRQFVAADLLELQSTGDNKDFRTIKNVVRENYSHNNLLKEIKTKASQSSLKTSSNITQDDDNQ
jgi:hypothetical protein